MTDHTRPDAVDRAAGIDPDGPTFALRERRPEYLEGAEACRVSTLHPDEDLGLPPDLRAAVAHRAARTAGRDALLAQYPKHNDATLTALAVGDTPEDTKLAALARHIDMIASDPGQSDASDLQTLRHAGFTVAQIVALSELLAFVCFQIRVAHGLALMEMPS